MTFQICKEADLMDGLDVEDENGTSTVFRVCEELH